MFSTFLRFLFVLISLRTTKIVHWILFQSSSQNTTLRNTVRGVQPYPEIKLWQLPFWLSWTSIHRNSVLVKHFQGSSKFWFRILLMHQNSEKVQLAELEASCIHLSMCMYLFVCVLAKFVSRFLLMCPCSLATGWSSIFPIARRMKNKPHWCSAWRASSSSAWLCI